MTSKKNTYRLINPYIEGSLDTIVHSKNAYRAGIKAYTRLSDYFTNHVENLNMTIMNVETKQLNHYSIKEKREGDAIDFSIVSIPDNLPQKTEADLINNINKMEKQSGGKKKKHRSRDDDSSDSSSSSSDSSSFSSDYFNVLPITKFVYFHLPYYKLINISPIDRNKLFLPIFTLPLTPTIEINLDLYKF